MKRLLAFLLVLSVGIVLFAAGQGQATPGMGPYGPIAGPGAGPYALNVGAASQINPNIRNIIIYVPDGVSQPTYSLTRWYMSYDPATGRVDPTVRLSFDDYASGLVRTWWQSYDTIGMASDSAPAATAMATGAKANDRFIGVDYESRPRVTAIEAAKLIGKSTGIIANSNIQHATPGAWTSHIHNRSWFCTIGEQQVYGKFDVMLGGGSQFLQPPYRQDGENILESAKGMGYQIITTRDELARVDGGPVLGLFADDYLHFHLDKPHLAPHQPTLSEMTAKAIEILNQNPDGFFLMVEDSIVDWSQHANDPVASVTNLVEFDRAVRMGLDFAKANQDTLVLILSDHGVGGLSIGDYQTGGYSAETPWTYPTDPVQKFVAPLHKARLTGNGVPFKFNEDFTNVREVVAEWFGIDDLTDEEYGTLREYIDKGYFAEPWGMNYALGDMISRRAFLSWTTFGHTGEEINLFSYFPGGSKLTGTIENIDIARVTTGVWGTDLDVLTRQHFIDAEPAFTAKGAAVEIQNADVRSGGAMVVTKDGTTIEIPENKNYVIRNGERVEVPLVNVHMPTIEKFFVSQAVLDLIP